MLYQSKVFQKRILKLTLWLSILFISSFLCYFLFVLNPKSNFFNTCELKEMIGISSKDTSYSFLTMLYNYALTAYWSNMFTSYEHNASEEFIFTRKKKNKWYLEKIIFLLITILVFRFIFSYICYLPFKKYYTYPIDIIIPYAISHLLLGLVTSIFAYFNNYYK